MAHRRAWIPFEIVVLIGAAGGIATALPHSMLLVPVAAALGAAAAIVLFMLAIYGACVLRLRLTGAAPWPVEDVCAGGSAPRGRPE